MQEIPSVSAASEDPPPRPAELLAERRRWSLEIGVRSVILIPIWAVGAILPMLAIGRAPFPFVLTFILGVSWFHLFTFVLLPDTRVWKALDHAVQERRRLHALAEAIAFPNGRPLYSRGSPWAVLRGRKVAPQSQLLRDTAGRAVGRSAGVPPDHRSPL